MNSSPTALVHGFVEACRVYARAAKLSEATVSTQVFDDGKRLRLLANGEADLTTRRLVKAQARLADLWEAHQGKIGEAT